jgi:hypothetical protein
MGTLTIAKTRMSADADERTTRKRSSRGYEAHYSCTASASEEFEPRYLGCYPLTDFNRAIRFGINLLVTRSSAGCQFQGTIAPR